MPPPSIRSLLNLFKPDSAEAAPPVRFVPAPYFFVRAEPFPEGMQPAETPGFVEVTLEGLAPMPLDQLAWGWFADDKSKHVFIFAAARERLAQENLPTEESFFHVLPSFFAAAPADGHAHWVFLWEAGFVTALHYQAGETVPARMELERVTEDNSAGAFAARERLLKRLPPTARTEAAPGLLSNPEALRGSREHLEFYYTQYSGPEAEPVIVDGNPPAKTAARWTADLRDPLFRGMEQQRRKSTTQATTILQVAGGVALVLLALQLAWAGGWLWLQATNKKITTQRTAVDAINDDQTLLTKIEQFSERQLRPMEMLGFINDLRPNGVIYINTLKLSKGNLLTTEVQAANAPLMNEFIDSLNQQSFLDLVEASHATNRLGHVEFALTVRYRDLPGIEPFPTGPTPGEIAKAQAEAAKVQAAKEAEQVRLADEANRAAIAAQQQQLQAAPNNFGDGPPPPPPGFAGPNGPQPPPGADGPNQPGGDQPAAPADAAPEAPQTSNVIIN